MILVAIAIGGIIYVPKYARLISLATGYGAKRLCSCALISEQKVEDIIKNELNFFPVYWGGYQVNYEDSTATGSFLGMFKREAIYRKGFGCTLVIGTTKEALLAKKFPQMLIEKDSIAYLEWPLGDRVEITIPSGIDSTELNNIVERAFIENGEPKRRVRSVIVAYNGQIIAERYADGFDKDSKLLGWSMSKSILNGIFGRMYRDSLFHWHDPAPVKPWQRDERSAITYDDLLRQSSGLQWQENYGVESHVTKMLFNSYDMAAFAAQSPLREKTRETFAYSSGSSLILSGLMKQKLGSDNYLQYPYRELFHKIGMFNTVIETDPSGTYVFSSYTYATARDWARFGQLYCNGGIWEGERILPKDWITYTNTTSKNAIRGEHGPHFWMNAGNPKNPNRTYGIWPSLPADMIYADGFEGQKIFIIPSKRIVVVILALTRGNLMNVEQFIADLVSCIDQSENNKG